jgi:hypothetical protein
MSTHKHATISAWQRQEHGGYAAEIEGWELRVHWHPEAPGAKRGFSWDAKHGDRPRFVSKDLFEEIELAMVAAELYPKAVARDSAAAIKAKGEAADEDAHP